MITHIRMKNFKSWKDSGKVQLAPLTGFFGTNSSGKSSLLQMLLLLKQTVGSEDILFFGNNGSLVNLGNFREVIHAHESDSDLHLQIACKLSHSFPEMLTTSFQLTHFAFGTVIREKEGKPSVSSFHYKSLCSNTGITWENNILTNVDNNLINGTDIQNCYGNPLSIGTGTKGLEAFTSVFEELFSHVFYLGPTRVHPQRQYQWEGSHPQDLGQFGNKTVDALLSARVDKRTILHKGEVVSIEERISEWLQKMDLAYSFLLERTGTKEEKEYKVHIQKKEYGIKIPLADMGFGLSQFLPVLVLCYYVPEGSTLIFEQPGIHLHPMAQSQLADLFIEVITERKLQILVESHSEHLLTRLQLRIAEEKISSDQTALYFCENEDGTSKITSLSLDKLGNITNWPKNFFGNVRGDLTKMTREQIKRQKNAED